MTELACRFCTRKVCSSCALRSPNAGVALNLHQDKCFVCRNAASACGHYQEDHKEEALCRDCKRCIRCDSREWKTDTHFDFCNQQICMTCHFAKHTRCLDCGKSSMGVGCLRRCSDCGGRSCSECSFTRRCVKCHIARQTGARCTQCNETQGVGDMSECCHYCRTSACLMQRCAFCELGFRSCCQHARLFDCSRCEDSKPRCFGHSVQCPMCIAITGCVACFGMDTHTTIGVHLQLPCMPCEARVREVLTHSAMASDLQRLLYKCLLDTPESAKQSANRDTR